MDFKLCQPLQGRLMESYCCLSIGLRHIISDKAKTYLNISPEDATPEKPKHFLSPNTHKCNRTQNSKEYKFPIMVDTLGII